MPSDSDTTRQPGNLGRLIGPKPPFKPKHIWAIRTRLQHEARIRDLALFMPVRPDRKLARRLVPRLALPELLPEAARRTAAGQVSR
jgi:hypothetical protein